MTLADGIAIARALALAPVAWAILADQNVLALAIFAVAAASDALDGPLARRAGTTGTLGAYLDPIADKILVVGTLLALTAAGRGWPVTVVAVLAIVREGIAAILRTRALARGAAQPADRVAKLKTAAEMIGVALIILDGRPWAVLGTGIAGIALLVGLATLPRYATTRAA